MSKLLKYSANLNCIKEEDSYLNFLPPSPLVQWATCLRSKALHNLVFFAQLFKQVGLIKLKSITDTLVVEKLNFLFARVREKRRTELRSAVHKLKLFSLACLFFRDDRLTGSILSNSNPTTQEELSACKPRSEYDRRQMVAKTSEDPFNSTDFLNKGSSYQKEFTYLKMGKIREVMRTSPSKSQLSIGQSLMSARSQLVNNLLASRKVTTATKLGDHLRGILIGSGSLMKLNRNGSVQDLAQSKESLDRHPSKEGKLGGKESFVKQNFALLSFLKLFRKKEREMKTQGFSKIQTVSKETETRRHKVYHKEVAMPKAALLHNKFKKKPTPTMTSLLPERNSTGVKGHARLDLKAGIQESMLGNAAFKKYESNWVERGSLHSEITRGINQTESYLKTSFGNRSTFSPMQEKYRTKRSPDKYSWAGVPSSPKYRTFHQFIAPDYRFADKKPKIDYNPALRLNVKSRDRREFHGF